MTSLSRLWLVLALVTGTTLGGTSPSLSDHTGPHIDVRAGALCQPWSDTNLHMVWMAAIIVHEHHNVTLEVTSCRSEAPHRVERTLHREDQAVDMTWKAYSIEGIHIADHLRQVLGPDFDVVVYDTHLHAEFDP